MKSIIPSISCRWKEAIMNGDYKKEFQY